MLWWRAFHNNRLILKDGIAHIRLVSGDLMKLWQSLRRCFRIYHVVQDHTEEAAWWRAPGSAAPPPPRRMIVFTGWQKRTDVYWPRRFPAKAPLISRVWYSPEYVDRRTHIVAMTTTWSWPASVWLWWRRWPPACLLRPQSSRRTVCRPSESCFKSWILCLNLWVYNLQLKIKNVFHRPSALTVPLFHSSITSSLKTRSSLIWLQRVCQHMFCMI